MRPNRSQEDRIARLRSRPLFASAPTLGRGQAPPAPDTSVLVHDCFDQAGGEHQPECACSDRIGRLDAAALIKAGKADALRITRNGRLEIRRSAIVLRRAYVLLRLKARKVNPRKALNALLKPANRLTFRAGVIRDKHGNAFEIETDNDSAHYWNGVLVAMGLGAQSGKFMQEAAVSKGLASSLTTIENFQMAPIALVDGLDPEVNGLLASEINGRKTENRRRRCKVGAAGFVKGSGGVTYGDCGKIKDINGIYSVGNSRDSDETYYESHEATGQLSPAAHDRERKLDKRYAPRDADPDEVQAEIDIEESKRSGELLIRVYDPKAQEAKAELEELTPLD
jgi:hypothetical protein